MLHIELTEHKADGTTRISRSTKSYRTMRGAQRLFEEFERRYRSPRYSVRIVGEPEQRRTHDNGVAIGQVHVGDVFHCAWGYDMTINDFYEVVAMSKSDKSVTTRKIATRMDGDPYSPIRAQVSPILTGDRFIGKPERHLLQSCGEGDVCICIDGCTYAFLMEPEDYVRGYGENHLD